MLLDYRESRAGRGNQETSTPPDRVIPVHRAVPVLRESRAPLECLADRDHRVHKANLDIRAQKGRKDFKETQESAVHKALPVLVVSVIDQALQELPGTPDAGESQAPTV